MSFNELCKASIVKKNVCIEKFFPIIAHNNFPDSITMTSEVQ